VGPYVPPSGWTRLVGRALDGMDFPEAEEGEEDAPGEVDSGVEEDEEIVVRRRMTD